MANKLAKKDLSTFSESDLNTLYSYYKIPPALPKKQKINALIHHIYSPSRGSAKKASLPPGTIWDAIQQDKYQNFLEFVNDPSFDKDVINNGFTLLTFVLSKKRKDINKYVEKLIEKGVDVNKSDNSVYTPIIMAILENDNDYNILPTVKLLLKAGANPNANEKIYRSAPVRYAIDYAVQKAHPNSIESSSLRYIPQLLLDYGAKVTPRSVDVSCMYFEQKQNTKMLDLLIDYNLSDINLTTINDKCRNYILEKLKSRLQPYFEVFSPREVEYLKTECDLNTIKGIYKCLDMAENMYKYHPLNENAEELGKKYKEHSYFQPKKASLPEGTIWDAIKQDNYKNFLEFVNDPSFDKNVMMDDFTLLTFILAPKPGGSYYKNTYNFIEKLIEKGIGVNKQDHYYPLMVAIMNNNALNDNTNIVELLLKAGADPNIRGGHKPSNELLDGTALEFAIYRSVAESSFTWPIVKILLDYGAKITPKALEMACNHYISNKKNPIGLDLLINVSSTDNELPDYIPTFSDKFFDSIKTKCHEYIITKLKSRLDPYFEVFSSGEVEYLKTECDLNTLKGIYKCIDMAENMYKYHPLNEKAEELGKKYKDHSYFQPKK